MGNTSSSKGMTSCYRCGGGSCRESCDCDKFFSNATPRFESYTPRYGSLTEASACDTFSVPNVGTIASTVGGATGGMQGIKGIGNVAMMAKSCPVCDGQGMKDEIVNKTKDLTCSICYGEGKQCVEDKEMDNKEMKFVDCENCSGSGKCKVTTSEHVYIECNTCDGKGFI
eukprot:515649_1